MIYATYLLHTCGMSNSHVTRRVCTSCVQNGKQKVAQLKGKYAESLDVSSRNWVVITSVNPPTRQVQNNSLIYGT